MSEEERGTIDSLIRERDSLKQRVTFLETQLSVVKKENYDLKQRLLARQRPPKLTGLLLRIWETVKALNGDQLIPLPVRTERIIAAYKNICIAENITPIQESTIARRLRELRQNGWLKWEIKDGVEWWFAIQPMEKED